jgi:hypothetical protein
MSKYEQALIDVKALEMMRADYPGAKPSDNPLLYEEYKFHAEKALDREEKQKESKGRVIDLRRLDARQKVAVLKEALELAEYELRILEEQDEGDSDQGEGDGVARKKPRVVKGEAGAREVKKPKLSDEAGEVHV